MIGRIYHVLQRLCLEKSSPHLIKSTSCFQKDRARTPSILRYHKGNWSKISYLLLRFHKLGRGNEWHLRHQSYLNGYRYQNFRYLLEYLAVVSSLRHHLLFVTLQSVYLLQKKNSLDNDSKRDRIPQSSCESLKWQ